MPLNCGAGEDFSKSLELQGDQISSVQFNCSVLSNSLQSHGLQHTRPPCPSLTPGVYSCPSSRWCHPTTSSSVVPFSRLQSFPASGSFPMSWLFTSGGQNIRASASALVLAMNIQGLISFRIDWFDLLAVQGTLKSLLYTRIRKHQFFSTQPSLWSNSHIYTWLLEKPQLWLYRLNISKN